MTTPTPRVGGNQFGTFLSNLGINTPKRKGTGYNYAPFTVQQGQLTPGQKLDEAVNERKSSGENFYKTGRQESTNRVATDIAGKSAFNIPTDEFGLVNNELTDFRSAYDNRLKTIDDRGKLALQTEEAKRNWQFANEMQNLGQYAFTDGMTISGVGADIPGATGNNPGAKAVSLAMQAQRNGTPYQWGGNSLTRGVDCSGLVQQVYRQLGISVPRTTYEQARNGKRVGLNEMRPGDLVFYRNNSHVGIYIGNGKFVHAANSKLGTIVSSVYGSSNGNPEMAIRPY